MMLRWGETGGQDGSDRDNNVLGFEGSGRRDVKGRQGGRGDGEAGG